MKPQPTRSFLSRLVNRSPSHGGTERRAAILAVGDNAIERIVGNMGSTQPRANTSPAPVRRPSAGPRRTPRTSLIVVLPENHTVSPSRLADQIPSTRASQVDVIVACAGQPTNLGALQRTIGQAQFLLAPAGTSAQDLRELAMRQAPGDIVNLVSGCFPPATLSAERELSVSS